MSILSVYRNHDKQFQIFIPKKLIFRTKNLKKSSALHRTHKIGKNLTPQICTKQHLVRNKVFSSGAARVNFSQISIFWSINILFNFKPDEKLHLVEKQKLTLDCKKCVNLPYVLVWLFEKFHGESRLSRWERVFFR